MKCAGRRLFTELLKRQKENPINKIDIKTSSANAVANY